MTSEHTDHEKIKGSPPLTTTPILVELLVLDRPLQKLLFGSFSRVPFSEGASAASVDNRSLDSIIEHNVLALL